MAGVLISAYSGTADKPPMQRGHMNDMRIFVLSMGFQEDIFDDLALDCYRAAQAYNDGKGLTEFGQDENQWYIDLYFWRDIVCSMTQRSESPPPQFPWMDEKPSKQQGSVPPVQTKPRNTPREELGRQQQELPPVLPSNLASSPPHCIDSLVSAQAQSALLDTLLDSELSRNRYTSRSPLMKFDEKTQTYKWSIRIDHYPEVDTRLPEIFMKDEGALALENRFPGIRALVLKMMAIPHGS